MYCFDEIRNTDAELAELMSNEISRQDTSIELIASENFVSRSVMAAMGSPLTNKYAEGYPGRRYYGGCECVDTVENLARDRVKQLFSAEHANVQPHSGSQANTAVYFAMLKPGDLIMGMNLAHGGHLTHGSPVNISGSQYKIIPYGVDEKTGYIDYDELRKSAKENLPKLIIAGASAYPRTIDFKAFAEIAQECGAYLMVDMAHIAGLVATGEHPSPIPYADFVTSTTHKTLRGPRGGLILCKSKYAKIVDKAIFPGIQGGPLMHIIAAKAVCFSEALSESFGIYQAQTVKNAKALAASLMDKGFNLVSGGTDNHLMLVDLRNTGVTGKVLEKRLDEAGVTCNKNAIPFDPLSPNVTSGIRLGTPAVTTRGMKESDMEIIAEIIRIVVDNSTDAMEKAKEMSKQLISKYPLNY